MSELMTDFDCIKAAWSRDTATPGTGCDQGPRGQCDVTALLVQDWFGGQILRAVVERNDLQAVVIESHYWNRIPGMGEVDLTRDQYPCTLSIPRGEIVRREYLLEGERAIAAGTFDRYRLLKKRAEEMP